MRDNCKKEKARSFSVQFVRAEKYYKELNDFSSFGGLFPDFGQGLDTTGKQAIAFEFAQHGILLPKSCYHSRRYVKIFCFL